MKKVLRYLTLLILIIGIGTGSYMMYMYHSVKETLGSIYEPIQPIQAVDSSLMDDLPLNLEKIIVSTDSGKENPTKNVVNLLSSKAVTEVKPVNLNNKEPFTLLFMGVDERKADHGRSDSIIVLAVNPAKHSVLMFNIPRDTRTQIVGRGTMDKINHAYAFGDVNMTVDTVENFLNIPINYYVKVNMEGFANIIDVLGGVEVNNEFEFTYEGVTYPQGAIALDGQHALMYSRMRHDDPQGDIGRNVRQQNILAELIGRAKKVSTVGKLPEILKQIKENTKTNLTMDDMIQLYNEYRVGIEVIHKDKVEGSGEMIDHIYYYVVKDTERERIRTKLLEQLQ